MLKPPTFVDTGIEVPASITDPSIADYIQGEWNSFLKSLYSRLDSFWFCSPTNIILAEDKPKQLVVAKRLGFNIPESTITNSFEEIKVVAIAFK